MSPSWRRRIKVTFAPDQISLQSWGRGFRPQVRATERIALSSESATDWNTAINALTEALASAQGGDVDILISDHFVHYAVLPEGAELTSVEQRRALAGIVFGRQYGALCQDWDIQVSRARSGEPALACGIPRPLLAALLAALPRGARLRSLQPVFMDVFNRHRRFLAHGNTCLSVVEAGRITMAWMRDGRWQNVASRAVAVNDSLAIPRLLREQMALQGRDEQGLLWLCDMTESLALPADLPWPVRQVPPPSINADALKRDLKGILMLGSAMRPLWLDYRRPPPGQQWPGIVLLAVGVVAAAILVAYDVSLRASLEDSEVRVHRLHRQTDRLQAEESTSETKPADEVARALATHGKERWETLFKAFEGAADESVTLLSLTPDSVDIIATGEAKHLSDALDYVRRLQRSPILTAVRLTEDEVAKEHPQRPVRFTVSATWKDAVP